MFCKNCGTQLPDNSRFCGTCGTVQDVPATPPATPFAPPSTNTLTSGASADGSLTMKYLIAAATFVLMIIFRFVSFCSLEANLLGESRSPSVSINYSINYLMTEAMESSAEAIVTVILMIVAAALCLLPLLNGKVSKRNRLILPKLVAFWNAFLLVLCMWACSESVSSAGADWSLTFGGWLNILVTLASIVLLFMISSKTKALSK